VKRLFLTLWILAIIIAIFTLVSIPLDRSLHLFRYTGYTLFVLVGTLFISMGFITMRKSAQEGKKTVWYKQPLVITGVLLLLSTFLSFYTLDLSHLFAGR